MENSKRFEQVMSPEEVEKIDAEINELLKSLDDYVFSSFEDDVQEEWISVEQEAGAGLDRATSPWPILNGFWIT